MRAASNGGNVIFVSHAPVNGFAGSSSPFFFFVVDFFSSDFSSFFFSESLFSESDFLSASLPFSPSPSFFSSALGASPSFGGVHDASFFSYSSHFLRYSTAFASTSRSDLPDSRRLRSVH